MFERYDQTGGIHLILDDSIADAGKFAKKSISKCKGYVQNAPIRIARDAKQWNYPARRFERSAR